MRKLTYLANARMPTEKAHGIQIIKMCEAFALAGLEVELVLPWRFNKIKADIFEYYGVKQSFKIRRLPSLDLIPLGIPRVCFWVQSFTFAFSVFFCFLFKKTDLIYSRDSLTLFLLSFFNKNLVYEAHTFPKNFFLHQRVFKKAKAIIVITQKLKDFFIQRGIAADKILVAPDGVDLEKFNIKETQEQCRQKLNLPLDKKIVMYVGLFEDWKGYSTLLQASKFFNKEIKLVMIGGTEKQVGKQKKEYPDVIFLGYLPYTSLPVNQKAADVLVLPNSAKQKISQYWTSPLKLFSYMTSQRPIVASDLPSLREILNENRAILVQADNPKAFAEGIEKALKNPHFSAEIATEAFKEVKKHTWLKRTGKILEFIYSYDR